MTDCISKGKNAVNKREGNNRQIKRYSFFLKKKLPCVKRTPPRTMAALAISQLKRRICEHRSGRKNRTLNRE